MFDTEEALIEFCKKITYGEEEALRDNNYTAKFVWYEGSDPRLFLFPDIPEAVDRDEGLNKIGFALHALSPAQKSEYLIFAVDSYQAKSMTKHDGSDWGPGGMAYAFNNKTVDADLVHESFTVTVTDRNGWHGMVGVPYYRDGAGGIVFDWDSVTAFIEGVDADNASGGVFPELMGSAMTQPHLLENEVLKKAADAFGFSDTKRDMHMLCAAVKTVMMQTGFACAIPARNDEERETLTMSFSGEENFDSEEIGFGCD